MTTRMKRRRSGVVFIPLEILVKLYYLQPERKKSKAEVMAEVIAKSKEHKVRLVACNLCSSDLRP